MSSVITLTTDFGLSDGYVGTMHGVILGIYPAARIVDLSHDIAPQNVRQAAFVLYAAYPFFPPGTIHVVVVDPGVGSDRRAIAVQTKAAYLVAPDNGVLSYVLAKEEIVKQVHLTKPDFWLPAISHTFHGRDIFAPVAAHLARGVSLDEMGVPTKNLVKLPFPKPQIQPDGSIWGHILHTDRFGNLITDVREELLLNRESLIIHCAGQCIESLSETYASVDDGQLVGLIGSEGHLQIAIRNGNAAQRLGVGEGDQVIVRRKG